LPSFEAQQEAPPEVAPLLETVPLEVAPLLEAALEM
jgi:hypothetical protein